MSYESPIKLTNTMESIVRRVREEEDKKIYECIANYGIDVNKEELEKALRYDRDQYVKGYEDGKADAMQWIPIKFKETTGEFYPCKPDIFKATYEPVEGTGDWKDRFKAEYKQLKDRYDKLHSMCIKYEAGTLDFEPNCPLALLKDQEAVMGNYLKILEVRGEIEKIDLKGDLE